VQAARPAKYGPVTASQESFRRAIRSALVFKVAYGSVIKALRAGAISSVSRGTRQDGRTTRISALSVRM
jgi:hypothetical protein